MMLADEEVDADGVAPSSRILDLIDVAVNGLKPDEVVEL